MNLSWVVDETLLGHLRAVENYSNAVAEVGLCSRVYPWECSRTTAPLAADGDGLAVVCGLPPLMKPVPERTSIALLFHEWTRMPAPWVRSLQGFREVWVASTFVRDVLEAGGFENRIRLFPIPHETPAEASVSRSEAGPFTFLSVGGWHFRKGFHLLIESFRRAFGGSEEVKLHIKTSSLGDYPCSDRNIHFTLGDLPSERLAVLYRESHAYVTCSLGEGFGLPVAEAMAAGLPVAAPSWSALRDLCAADRAFHLPFQAVPQPYCSRPDYYAPGQECGMVDIEGTAEILRQVVRDRDLREAKAAKALAWVQETLSPREVGGQIGEAVAEIASSSAG